MSLVVDTLDPQQAEAIEPLLRAYPHRLAPSPPGADQRDLARHLLRCVLRPGDQANRAILGAYQNGILHGLAGVEPLAWESGIYGFKMGCIPVIVADGQNFSPSTVYRELIEQALQRADSLGCRHLSCRIPAGDIPLRHALEDAGFSLMDTTVQFSWPIRDISVEETSHARVLSRRFAEPRRIFRFGVEVRPVVESDIAVLKQLAREAFTQRTQTRFSGDPSLPQAKSAELYAEWFHNSCKGTFADLVLVAAYQDRPIGFVTVKLQPEISKDLNLSTAQVGIGAVSPEAGRFGVTPSLLAAMIAWCSEKQVDACIGRVLVNNIAVYKSCLLTGAEITDAFHTFHKQMSPIS